MSAWLPWILGSTCGLMAVLQVVVGIWCIVELCRKWRGAFELWGLDWLDIVYRLEGRFGVTLRDTDFVGLSRQARVALTAGQLWDVVAAEIRASGRDVPADGWDRVVTEVSEARNVKRAGVVPEARLFADLGMSHGIG